MGRGQYDRAAAKAKREGEQPVGVVNGYGQPVSQADYDALVAKYDRLLRLCQTHGLMING